MPLSDMAIEQRLEDFFGEPILAVIFAGSPAWIRNRPVVVYGDMYVAFKLGKAGTYPVYRKELTDLKPWQIDEVFRNWKLVRGLKDWGTNQGVLVIPIDPPVEDSHY